jgi:hypothetical protein
MKILIKENHYFSVEIVGGWNNEVTSLAKPYIFILYGGSIPNIL